MNELIITNLITAIATISAAFVGGYFMYKSNAKKDQLYKLRKNSYRYLQEIKIFYELEQKYIEELELKTSIKQLVIKKEMRSKLNKKPSMTSNDVDRILSHNKYLEFCNG